MKLLSTATGTAELLSLAAAPTFAIMAVLSGVGGSHETLCAPMQSAPSLGGMQGMYALMGVFHAASWIRRFASQTHRTKRRQIPLHLPLPSRDAAHSRLG
jgi:hypothetical protein